MDDDTTPAPRAGQAPARDDPRLEHQVLSLVRNWMRRSREAASARTEAALDRGSFESFPASDPVAPAIATSEHTPALEEVDCTMTADSLVFRCAVREADAGRPPPAWTIEGDAPGGGRMRLRVWVDDTSPRESVPGNLELPPEHASIRPRQHERRSGEERRRHARRMPEGFDRRVAQRRGAGGAQQAAG